MEECPICKKETEDMRHVGVECFYNVSEVADVDSHRIFTEVEKDATYWGVTRTVSGTKDSFEEKEVGDTIHIKTTQVPADDMRLLEKTIFSKACCKSCRGDFLKMFGKWCAGEIVKKEWKERERNK